jgi:hypothetical protein
VVATREDLLDLRRILERLGLPDIFVHFVHFVPQLSRYLHKLGTFLGRFSLPIDGIVDVLGIFPNEELESCVPRAEPLTSMTVDDFCGDCRLLYPSLFLFLLPVLTSVADPLVQSLAMRPISIG